MKRNKQLVIFLIFLFLIYPAARSSSEGGGSIGSGNIDDIAKALATYFPKATGKITAVNQDIVQIQSEKEAGLTAGTLLAVYREGNPFHHPVTDVILGNFEEEIGYLEVTKTQTGQITARVIGEIPPVDGLNQRANASVEGEAPLVAETLMILPRPLQPIFQKQLEKSPPLIRISSRSSLKKKTA